MSRELVGKIVTSYHDQWPAFHAKRIDDLELYHFWSGDRGMDSPYQLISLLCAFQKAMKHKKDINLLVTEWHDNPHYAQHEAMLFVIRRGDWRGLCMSAKQVKHQLMKMWDMDVDNTGRANKGGALWG